MRIGYTSHASQNPYVPLALSPLTLQVAHLQDALVHAVKSLAVVVQAARKAGVSYDKEIDRFMLSSVFSTLTNVNFDADAFVSNYIPKVLAYRDAVKRSLGEMAALPEIANWVPGSMDKEGLEAAGLATGVFERRAVLGEEPAALHELIMYGIKGTAAYADHALIAGVEDEEVYSGLYDALDVLGRGVTDGAALVACAMGVGATNVKTMAALDRAHCERFGVPTPTELSFVPRPGKCILISGHDLVDLEIILKATEGTGINVYTHGEMLVCFVQPRGWQQLVCGRGCYAAACVSLGRPSYRAARLASLFPGTHRAGLLTPASPQLAPHFPFNPILLPRCSPHTATPSSRRTRTWRATTALPGSCRRSSTRPSPAPSCSPPTASWSRARATRTACSRPTPRAGRA
jgi:hypothetical protein